jgi:beta-CASP RNase J family ribonuclease
VYDDAPKKSASDEFKDFSNDYSVRANDQYNDDLIDDPPIKILPLGGLGEIGMNCMLVGVNDRYILLDAGLMFPDHEELGIQKVLPDVSFLSRWRDKIEAVVITHGHEDHIGALPWAIPALDPNTPVYAGNFTMQLISRRMVEYNLWNPDRFKVMEMGQRFKAGPFEIEAVRVTHSIPDCCGLIFRSEHGTIVHTGDWKIDENPVDNQAFDRTAWETVGKEGVTLMMSDSTNVLSSGRTTSESEVREAIMRKVIGHKGRIISTQFASNIHRLYGIRDAAEATGRSIAFVGQSLYSYLEAAKKAGMAPFDPSKLVPAEDIDSYDPSKLLIVTTGSQGEPNAQLSRAACGASPLLTLRKEDLLLYSAKMIPGNEKKVMRMMNQIAKIGPQITMKREDGLHSSGHAHRDELDEVLKLIKPEHFLPVHGEYAFLKEHERLARECGVLHTSVIGNGTLLGVTPLKNKKAHGTLGNFHRIGSAKLQTMFNDGGKGSGTAEDLAIEERMRIATEGVIVVDFEVMETAGYAMNARARVTSRGMWTDNGRLLRSLKDAAVNSCAGMNYDTKLSAIERTVARAIRFAARSYCNKKPDVIVVAHRKPMKSGGGGGLTNDDDDNNSNTNNGDASGEDLNEDDDDQKRYRKRVLKPEGVRPLRGDYKGPGAGGPARQSYRDSAFD